MQNKNIRTYNHDFKRHGYWETYWYKCFYVNDIEYGYSELLTNKLYRAR